jgi:hypothetical protein
MDREKFFPHYYVSGHSWVRLRGGFDALVVKSTQRSSYRVPGPEKHNRPRNSQQEPLFPCLCPSKDTQKYFEAAINFLGS